MHPAGCLFIGIWTCYNCPGEAVFQVRRNPGGSGQHPWRNSTIALLEVCRLYNRFIVAVDRILDSDWMENGL